MDSLVHKLAVSVIILALITSCIGLFDPYKGASKEFVNQYGDDVIIYGSGLYRNDSRFMAPILRGTDFTIAVFVVPMMLIALLCDIAKKGINARMILTGLLFTLSYYSSGLVFGVTYNYLQLVYISLFSASMFGFVAAFISLLSRYKNSFSCSAKKVPYYIFLWVTGIGLIVAWLPDIITALMAKRSLLLIEIYTTQITYAMDMGIIAPMAFITAYLLKKDELGGYVALNALLVISIVIGMMLPIQTVFQIKEGIDVPLDVLITKIGIFVVIAIFALALLQNLLKHQKAINIQNQVVESGN